VKHQLKIQRPYYERILSGEKKFEIRYNDRDYQKNDILILNALGSESTLKAKIIYIHTELGMAEGYVVLGIEVLGDEET